MKKRIISYILLLCVLFAVCPLTAAATEADSTEATEATAPERAPNQCGESMYWSFDTDTLTITGSGKMDDFETDAPWAEFKDDIVAVILDGKITYIGARAFKNYDNLQLVDFGSDLYEIGEEAFWSCEGLTVIALPESFKIFGPSSFLSCTNLKEIHCAGRFPSFRLNSMWDVYATIYYPAERPWSVNTIAELEAAFKGRIEFLDSSGKDHYTPTEPTEATTEPTEETTEPTEATTEPTEATTEPTEVTTEPTEVTTEPTEATTQPTEEVTEATAPTEEAREEEEKSSGNVWLWVAIVSGVVALGAVGTLVFALTRKGGKYAAR